MQKQRPFWKVLMYDAFIAFCVIAAIGGSDFTHVFLWAAAVFIAAGVLLLSFTPASFMVNAIRNASDFPEAPARRMAGRYSFFRSAYNTLFDGTMICLLYMYGFNILASVWLASIFLGTFVVLPRIRRADEEALGFFQ